MWEEGGEEEAEPLPYSYTKDVISTPISPLIISVVLHLLHRDFGLHSICQAASLSAASADGVRRVFSF